MVEINTEQPRTTPPEIKDTPKGLHARDQLLPDAQQNLTDRDAEAGVYFPIARVSARSL